MHTPGKDVRVERAHFNITEIMIMIASRCSLSRHENVLCKGSVLITIQSYTCEWARFNSSIVRLDTYVCYAWVAHFINKKL